ADLVDGVPFTFEVALAHTERPGRFFHGVNFSPTFDDPLARTALRADEFGAWGASGFLQTAGAHPGTTDARGPFTAAALHLVCPALEFLDKGKTTLRVPDAMAERISAALWGAVRDLYREGERRRKDAARQARADRRVERALQREMASEQ